MIEVKQCIDRLNKAILELRRMQYKKFTIERCELISRFKQLTKQLSKEII